MNRRTSNGTDAGAERAHLVRETETAFPHEPVELVKIEAITPNTNTDPTPPWR
jgi:hypothetical protein